MVSDIPAGDGKMGNLFSQCGGRGSILWLLVPAYAAPRNTDYVNRNYGYNLIGVIRRREGGDTYNSAGG